MHNVFQTSITSALAYISHCPLTFGTRPSRGTEFRNGILVRSSTFEIWSLYKNNYGNEFLTARRGNECSHSPSRLDFLSSLVLVRSRICVCGSTISLPSLIRSGPFDLHISTWWISSRFSLNSFDSLFGYDSFYVSYRVRLWWVTALCKWVSRFSIYSAEHSWADAAGNYIKIA